MKKIILISLASLSFQLQAKDYKGAEIFSNEQVLYGKFEMCMQASKAEGVLSTFFLYKNGSEIKGSIWEEIDIEIFGKNNAQSFQSNIITGTSTARITSEQVHKNTSSLADDFHTYGLEWTPEYIAWYLDGIQVRKTTGDQVSKCNAPMSYRLNTWAALDGNWVGDFIETSLPLNQFIDWLSYSAYTPGKGDKGSDFTALWKDDFNTFNSSRWGRANWTFDENLVDFEPNNINVKEGKLILSLTNVSATGFSGKVPKGGCSSIDSKYLLKQKIKIKKDGLLNKCNNEAVAILESRNKKIFF